MNQLRGLPQLSHSSKPNPKPAKTKANPSVVRGRGHICNLVAT